MVAAGEAAAAADPDGCRRACDDDVTPVARLAVPPSRPASGISGIIGIAGRLRAEAAPGAFIWREAGGRGHRPLGLKQLRYA